MIQYKINLSFNLGVAVDKVGELVEAMNASLSNWGIDDKLQIRSKGFSLTLQCNRKITKQEKEAMIKLIEDQFNKRFTGWNFKVESFRCKPCYKSEQSVS